MRTYSGEYIEIGPRLSPAVKGILAVTGICFVAQALAGARLTWLLGLVPGLALRHGYVWQFVSYIFIHAGVAHFLFNMLALWMFGCDVEWAMGSRRFLGLYLTSGIGAGICSYFFYPSFAVIVGASGAIFGLIVAYAMLFPDRVVTLLLFFVVPVSMRAKYLVLIFGGIELLFIIAHGQGDLVAHFAHLGGALFGCLYILWWKGNLRRESPRREQRLEPERIDDILDKVVRSGLSSLTDKEREILRRASRKF